MALPWHSAQAAFAKALRSPGPPAADGAARFGQQPSERRFKVYRNNVAVGLREALQSGFPVVRQVVGDDFFAAMAMAFIHSGLPKTPLLIEYGRDFPAFIARFEPAVELPYLADLARLEYGMTQAYHAPDAAPAPIDALAQLAEGQLENARFEFHPSLRLLTSGWPVFSIWQAHQQEDPQTPLRGLRFEREWGVIVRPGLDVDMRLLTPASYRFLAGLRDGRSLGEAAVAASDLDEAELSEMISALFELRLVTRVRG